MLFNSFQVLDLFPDRRGAVLQRAISHRQAATPGCKLRLLHVVGSAIHSADSDLHGS